MHPDLEASVAPSRDAPHMRRRSRGSRRENDRGGALVEFALVLPLLSMLTLGTVDVGRAYLIWNQVKNAAREGANYAQLHPGRQLDDGSGRCADPANVAWRARNEAGGAGSTFSVTVTPAATGGCDPASPPAAAGQPITVTVSQPLTLLTPLMQSMLGDPIVRASVRVNVQ